MESRSGQPRVFETNYAAGGRRLYRPKYKAQMPVFAVIICLEEFKKWTAEDGEDGGRGRRQTGRQKGGCQLVARERERERGGRAGGVAGVKEKRAVKVEEEAEEDRRKEEW